MIISSKVILLTFDVEDWFQVENLRPWMPFSSWDNLELRVERNTHHVLDLLDGGGGHASRSNISSKPKATFFILGWIAKRLPNIVREICQRGHEVASHGNDHQLCYSQTLDDLKRDLTDSRKLLEDIAGFPVYGYRAPSFSISDSVLKAIWTSGYRYDSSFNSFDRHGRYGGMTTDNIVQKNSIFQLEQDFYEIPLSNLKLFNQILPWAGGGYFRLLPLGLFLKGIRNILGKQNCYVFYAHPWEFDPKQPVVQQATFFNRFKHYINLSKTSMRLAQLIHTFSDCRFLTCHSYLNEIWGKNE